MDCFPCFCLSQNCWGALCEKVLTSLKRSNLQFIEGIICNLQGLKRNNLQFTGTFFLLALGSLLGCWYRWRFLWLTSEEFFWSTGRLECLPDDSSLYPLFLPLPLIFEWYQITSLKTRPKKGVSKPTALQNNDFCSRVTCHRELDQGNSIWALHLLLLCWVYLSLQ